MKWPAWLDTAPSNAFAREIAMEFTRNFRPVPGDKGSEQRLASATAILGNRAAKYHRQEALNWYRKAGFMGTIKEVLEEQGYARELVDRILYDVVMRMARKG
jgi:hypothetical protein